jgi:valyl-tRNA synthetase
MASPGTDIAFNVARTEGYRAFANKIWNAARFLFMNVDRAAEVGIFVDPAALGGMPVAAEDAPLEDRWIVAELHATAAKVNQSLENYRYDDAANTIYQFFWGSFCDWYLEIVKLRLDFPMDGPGGESASEQTSKRESRRAALTTLVSVFEASLRLLSPFMPFITEEIWHALYDGKPPAKSIALASYPQSNDVNVKDTTNALINMGFLQKLISNIRTARKEFGVEEKAIIDIELDALGGFKTTIRDNQQIVQRLAKAGKIQLVDRFSAGLLMCVPDPNFEAGLVYEKKIDVAVERARLTKEIARLEKGLAAAERQLGNEGFLKKAPPELVFGLRKQEAETRMLLNKARSAQDALPSE